MRARLALAAATALLAFAFVAPGLRRHFIRAVVTWDAEPREPVALPAVLVGVPLQPWPRVRVILIDGLSASTAQTLTTWSSLCRRGLDLTVDVGFPTVSLPVQVSLWTGLTQQQTGVVFRSDRPLVPPLAQSIPAQVPGSRAIAESHGYIVRSIGFADAEPAADATHAAKDADPAAWRAAWQARAKEAVASDARLAFVHVLRVDDWGHKTGRDSAGYRQAASEADAILAELYAAAPDARWFLLADHGHRAEGGHGGEEREIRQVEHCIVGPDITPHVAGPIHLVDMSRALADSVGATLDRSARGRPLYAAMAAPLSDDDSIPRQPLGTGIVAIVLLVIGALASAWGVRRWWLAPAWFAIACALFVIVRGLPTMSTRMIFAPEGRVMYLSWLAALPIATAATWFGLPRVGLARVLVAQLALPLAVLAAALTACGAWAALAGAEVAPVVARYTAYTSPLVLITAHGSAAVALAVLARTVHSVFDRRRSAGTPQTSP